MHGKWRVEPEDGGQVEATALALKPVDPVIYAMKDLCHERCLGLR